MNQHTIVFRTLSQKILFVAEISGQLSDGHWENVSPRNHWRVPTSAEVKVDPHQQGLSFIPSRSYNFANVDLIRVIGGTMLNAVKFFSTFPHLIDGTNLHDYRYEETAEQWLAYLETCRSHRDVYYHQKYCRVLKALNVTTLEGMIPLMKRVDAFDYGLPQLRTDLREMSDLFNETFRGEIGRLTLKAS